MSPTAITLHIGLPKTGTSYLQKILGEYRAKLLAHGTWVSSKPIFAHRFAVDTIADAARAGQADVRKIMEADLDAARDDLARAVADPSIKRAVVSSEYFFEGDAQRARALFEPFGAARLQVVVYLRRQDRLIESGYNQEVKAMGHREPPRPPVYTPRLDWSVVLGAWAEAFGEDSIAAIGYDKAAATHAVVDRFFAAIGAPVPAAAATAAPPDASPPVNESLPADLLEFKRLANSFGEFGLDRWLYQAMSASRWSDRFRFTREMAGRFLEIYGPSNDEVTRRYLGGDRSELALDEPLEDERQGTNFTGALPAETIAKLLALHLKGAMEFERAASSRIAKLEAELNSLRPKV
jgi:hypothetical protein